jgi:hypothetical protein
MTEDEIWRGILRLMEVDHNNIQVVLNGGNHLSVMLVCV